MKEQKVYNPITLSKTLENVIKGVNGGEQHENEFRFLQILSISLVFCVFRNNKNTLETGFLMNFRRHTPTENTAPRAQGAGFGGAFLGFGQGLVHFCKKITKNPKESRVDLVRVQKNQNREFRTKVVVFQ